VENVAYIVICNLLQWVQAQSGRQTHRQTDRDRQTHDNSWYHTSI